MNIHKYLLPASLAATVHVALFWLMPVEPYTRIIAVPLGTAKPPISDPVAEPPEEEPPRATSTEPVNPLAGKPAPPALEETPPARVPDNIFTSASERRPRIFDTRITTIPATIGPEGLPNGADVAQTTVYSPDLLDRVPSAKVQLPPDYPAAMRQSGVSGSVLVEFDVNAEGRVVRAEAIRYTHREFADPAVRAVRKWRFEAGRRHGQAVPFRLTVPIEFGIESN